jgi:hypothetical protein
MTRLIFPDPSNLSCLVRPNNADRIAVGVVEGLEVDGGLPSQDETDWEVGR